MELGREIAVVLVCKLLILAGLWFAFVRGNAVVVDERATAARFGLTNSQLCATNAISGECNGH